LSFGSSDREVSVVCTLWDVRRELGSGFVVVVKLLVMMMMFRCLKCAVLAAATQCVVVTTCCRVESAREKLPVVIHQFSGTGKASVRCLCLSVFPYNNF